MKITAMAVVLTTGLVLPTLSAGWPDETSKARLVSQLQAAYPLTVMDGLKVVKPGAVLVIQQGGIQANPLRIGPFRNKYENGQINAAGRDRLRQFDPTGGHWGFGSVVQARSLEVGEMAYLLSLDFRDDGLVAAIQTCGLCDTAADPTYKPYAASIQFIFTKGSWAATDLSHMEAAINRLLLVRDTASTASSQTADQRVQMEVPSQTALAEPSNESVGFPDLVPPDRPADAMSHDALPAPSIPDPVSSPQRTESKLAVKAAIRPETRPDIDFTWTIAQVQAVLGTPIKTEKQDRGGETYIYDHVTITFAKGKVAGIVWSR
jgi:hypothetical protein